MTSALAKSEEELSSILNALKDSTRRVLEAKSKDGTEMPKERHEVVTRSIDDLRARLEDKLKKTVGILPEEPAAKRQRTDPEEPAEDDSPDEELKALENAVRSDKYTFAPSILSCILLLVFFCSKRTAVHTTSCIFYFPLSIKKYLLFSCFLNSSSLSRCTR